MPTPFPKPFFEVWFCFTWESTPYHSRRAEPYPTSHLTLSDSGSDGFDCHTGACEVVRMACRIGGTTANGIWRVVHKSHCFRIALQCSSLGQVCTVCHSESKGAPLGLRVCRPPRQGFSKVYPNWDATGMHPGCRIGEWLHIGGHFRGMTRGCKGRGMGCRCSSRVSIEADIVEVLGYANTGVCTKEAAHFPASKNRFPPSVAVPPAWTAPSP